MATKANVEMEWGLGVVEHAFAQIRLVSVENDPNCVGLIQRLVVLIVSRKQGTARQAHDQDHRSQNTTSTHKINTISTKDANSIEVLQIHNILLTTREKFKKIYFGFV
jgi:hypothetical protein